MKTTLDLDDQLLTRAKTQAAIERKSLTRLIEEGLTLRLRPQAAPANAKVRKASFDLPSFSGGPIRPGIDMRSNQSMLDACDELPG